MCATQSPFFLSASPENEVLSQRRLGVSCTRGAPTNLNQTQTTAGSHRIASHLINRAIHSLISPFFFFLCVPFQRNSRRCLFVRVLVSFSITISTCKSQSLYSVPGLLSTSSTHTVVSSSVRAILTSARRAEWNRPEGEGSGA